MVDEMSFIDVSQSLGKNPQSDSKVDVDLGAKRVGKELEDDSDVIQKRAKMRDLQSVLQSEGIATYDPATSKMDEIEEHMDIIETQGSQTVDKNVIEHANAGLSEGAPKKKSMLCGSKPLDLNTDLCTDENSGYNDNVVSLGDSMKQGKGKTVNEFDRDSLSGSFLNFSTEEVTSSANHDLFTSKPHNNPKARDTSSCGKTAGNLEEKDALRKWKEMKQNGFMSSSYGGIPPPPPAAPKQRGRKSKSEVLKQKMEQAKKEQVDRFAKIAAPSGLLNGLNPGIINHVRNSKQVHSIIQALVRSEKQESLKQASELKAASRDLPEKHTGLENLCYSGLHGSLLPESTQFHENRLLHGGGSSLFDLGDKGGYGESIAKGKVVPSQTPFASHSTIYSNDDLLALKLASSNMVSESTSCLSNDESASVDTLSVKAATVASQWLQLLHQDIKGRLAALRRSKKRVHAVITTELPFLLSKEFESNQENDPSITKDPVTGCSNKVAAELHQAQWNKLFNQMDTSLSEEENQLECWLNDVTQMLQLCDKGLQHVQWNVAFEMQRMGALSNNFRSKIIDPEKELPVRAAAASIYSTGNYASSRENISGDN
ncbi:hypothetical protein RND81_10G047200 [Saponaria officinalis]|uniref:Uncharacterized protein n=1 Tax=Saponaria officinalis TaxID=3572 RepID=A0AAW1I0F6_SAPOF